MIPSVLVDPPWRRERKAPVEPQAAGAGHVEPEVVLSWEEGQRARWAGAIPVSKIAATEESDELYLERLLEAADRDQSFKPADVGRLGDEALGVWFDACPPARMSPQAMKHVIARLGAACFERAMTIVEAVLPNTSLIEAITPFVAPRVALCLAKAIAGGSAVELGVESYREERFTPSPAEAWLDRHPGEAERGLSPHALGAGDEDTRIVTACLRYLAARGKGTMLPYERIASLIADGGDGLDWIPRLVVFGHHRSIASLLAEVDDPRAVPLFVSWLDGDRTQQTLAGEWLSGREDLVRAADLPREVAERAERVAAGVEDPSDRDRMNDFPPEIPPAPAFWEPLKWPPILLEDTTPLSPEALEHLGEMLRFSPLSRPYAGLAHVKTACDRESLDRFMARLLDAWTDSGESAAHAWALAAAAHLGADECAFQIAKRIRSWAYAARGQDLDKESVSAKWKANAGIEALALMDAEAAVVHLDHFAKKAGQYFIRREAEDRLAAVPITRRVARTRLSSGKVPDLGLDARGRLTLDFGPRTFTVLLDETFSPVVLDADGARLKSFPRPTKQDDPLKAAEARRRHQRLKSEVKTIVTPQLARIEKAMCTRSGWTLDEFKDHFVAQPLMLLIARRVVWSLADGPRFRVDEGGQLVDRDDAPIPASASEVIVPHPIEMDPAELSRWRELFIDYELIQPFEQLARHTAPRPDTSSQVMPAATAPTATGRFFGLARRGWSPTFAEGVITGYATELHGGHHAELDISPGIDPTNSTDSPTQHVTEIRASVPLRKLAPIAYSELARDTDYLTRE